MHTYSVLFRPSLSLSFLLSISCFSLPLTPFSLISLQIFHEMIENEEVEKPEDANLLLQQVANACVREGRRRDGCMKRERGRMGEERKEKEPKEKGQGKRRGGEGESYEERWESEVGAQGWFEVVSERWEGERGDAMLQKCDVYLTSLYRTFAPPSLPNRLKQTLKSNVGSNPIFQSCKILSSKFSRNYKRQLRRYLLGSDGCARRQDLLCRRSFQRPRLIRSTPSLVDSFS